MANPGLRLLIGFSAAVSLGWFSGFRVFGFSGFRVFGFPDFRSKSWVLRL